MYNDYRRQRENLNSEINDLRRELNDLRREQARTEADLAAARRNPAQSGIIAAPVIPSAPQTITRYDTIVVREQVQGERVIIRDTVVQQANPVVVTEVRETPLDVSQIPATVVLFDVGKSFVKPVYHRQLNYVADLMKEHNNVDVVITGHTDKTGSAAINEALSKKRADAVAAYLKSRGIADNRIRENGVSSQLPVATGSDAVSLSQNRRVTIDLITR